MTIFGRFFWLLCIWIPFAICFEDFCSGNEIQPKKAWDDFNDAFKSRFKKESK